MGSYRQIEGLWDIRISDIIDLVLHIVVQFIVLYLIARGLTIVSNSENGSKFNFKDGKINILICLAILLFVGTSLLPILSPLTLLFTAGGTISVGVSAHKQISESFRNIGQKTIESSDVDNFLLSEIKEKLKIMNYIEREELLKKLKGGGGRRKK